MRPFRLEKLCSRQFHFEVALFEQVIRIKLIQFQINSDNLNFPGKMLKKYQSITFHILFLMNFINFNSEHWISIDFIHIIDICSFVTTQFSFAMLQKSLLKRSHNHIHNRFYNF